MNGDSYVTTLVGLAVDVNAPVFDIEDVITVDHTSTFTGDTLRFTVVLDNSAGTADADGVDFFFPLPEGLTLSTFALNGTPGDVAGSPVTTADLSSGVDVGTIGFGDAATVTMDIEVTAIPESPDEAQFTTQARWSYQYVSCAGQPDIQTELLSDPIQVLMPRLDVTISTDPAGPISRGAEVMVTIDVVNTGTADTADATLLAPVPVELEYVTDSTVLNSATVSDVTGAMPFNTAHGINSTGQPDGEEVFRGTDPLDPADDFPEEGEQYIVGGGGCECSVGMRVGGRKALSLFVFGFVVWLRRRH